MNTVARFKIVAMVGLLILLGTSFAVPSTAKNEIELCTTFDADIIKILDNDKNIKSRFFEKIKEGMSSGFNAEILAVWRIGDRDICIRYRKKTEDPLISEKKLRHLI